MRLEPMLLNLPDSGGSTSFPLVKALAQATPQVHMVPRPGAAFCLPTSPGNPASGSTTGAREAMRRLGGGRSRTGGAGISPGHTAPHVWQRRGRVEGGPVEGSHLGWLVQCCGALEENQRACTSTSPPCTAIWVAEVLAQQSWELCLKVLR